MPNSSCGLSQAMPNGPVDHPGGGEPPSDTMLGISNVYIQRTKPAASPPVTPARLAPGQYTAAMMRGRELRHRGQRQRADGRQGRRVGRQVEEAVRA